MHNRTSKLIVTFILFFALCGGAIAASVTTNTAHGPYTTYYVSSPTQYRTPQVVMPNGGMVVVPAVPRPVQRTNVIYNRNGSASSYYSYPGVTTTYGNYYYPTTQYQSGYGTIYQPPITTTTTYTNSNGTQGTVTNYQSGYVVPAGLNIIRNGNGTNVTRFLSW